MPEKALKVSVLNLKIHEKESFEEYVGLMETISRSRFVVKLRGSDYGLIGWQRVIEEDNKKVGVYGMLYKFLNIDPDEPWLDLRSNKKITKEAEDAPPVIPDHLKPNLREIPFYLDATSHHLFFEVRHISPRIALRFFEQCMSDRNVIAEFGPMDVCMATRKEGVEKILNIPYLRKIEYKLTRPNADELGKAFEKAMFDEMAAQGLVTDQRLLRGVKGGRIKPKEKLVNTMNLARNNGWVKGDGYGMAGEPMHEETQYHPVVEKTNYNEKSQSIFSVLMGFAAYIKTKL